MEVRIPMPLREMLDSKTREIHGNEMVGGRPEILQAGEIDPSSGREGQGAQGADHETAIESSEIPGETEIGVKNLVVVIEVIEIEDLPDEIGIETETGGIKKGRKAGVETKTGGKGTGNGIGQEVRVLPKGILLPVPANPPVVTATNTKRVNERKGREVKIRTETILKKR